MRGPSVCPVGGRYALGRALRSGGVLPSMKGCLLRSLRLRGLEQAVWNDAMPIAHIRFPLYIQPYYLPPIAVLVAKTHRSLVWCRSTIGMSLWFTRTLHDSRPFDLMLPLSMPFTLKPALSPGALKPSSLCSLWTASSHALLESTSCAHTYLCIHTTADLARSLGLGRGLLLLCRL